MGRRSWNLLSRGNLVSLGAEATWSQTLMSARVGSRTDQIQSCCCPPSPLTPFGGWGSAPWSDGQEQRRTVASTSYIWGWPDHAPNSPLFLLLEPCMHVCETLAHSGRHLCSHVEVPWDGIFQLCWSESSFDHFFTLRMHEQMTKPPWSRFVGSLRNRPELGVHQTWINVRALSFISLIYKGKDAHWTIIIITIVTDAFIMVWYTIYDPLEVSTKDPLLLLQRHQLAIETMWQGTPIYYWSDIPQLQGLGSLLLSQKPLQASILSVTYTSLEVICLLALPAKDVMIS